jgi:hypothetical protein
LGNQRFCELNLSFAVAAPLREEFGSAHRCQLEDFGDTFTQNPVVGFRRDRANASHATRKAKQVITIRNRHREPAAID